MRLWDLRTPLCQGQLHTPSFPIANFDEQVLPRPYRRLLLADILPIFAKVWSCSPRTHAADLGDAVQLYC